MSKKVLIGIITYAGKDYVFDDFLESVNNLTYDNKEVIIVDNSDDDLEYYNYLKIKCAEHGIKVFHIPWTRSNRNTMALCNNFCRRYAIDNGFDYMFNLESDVLCPPDIIERLIAHNKDVVTGLYLIGNGKVNVPCITLMYDTGRGTIGTRLLQPKEFKEYINVGLKEVAAGAFGCCLISRKILEQTRFYYDIRREKGSVDIYFFNGVINKGGNVYVDTDIHCDHQYKNRNNIEER